MPPLLEARDIRKQFPGVLALAGVSAHVEKGEVLALVGENGAGKSTLMKILAGVYQPDSGSLLLEGQEVRFPRVIDAMQAGVSLIHQELNLAENLSVAANLFLGREKTTGGFLKWLNRPAMREDSKLLLDRVGLASELVDTLVGELPPGQKQLVEIARALSLRAKIIIMDEPTSSLTQGETDRLYEVIDDLKRDGISVIYISHRLAEVKRVADRVTVLRDGRNAGELRKEEISHDAIVSRMVGRDLKQIYPHSKRSHSRDKPRLELREVRYRGGPPHAVSMSLAPGEIVGMAGLVGAGRTELAEAIFGIRHLESGEVLLDGKPLAIRSPRDAIESGIVLVPEDRRLHGLILPEGAGFNISLPNLDRLQSGRMVSRHREAVLARKEVDRLRVKTPNLSQAVGLLSGGNQQKVVLGKWLARDPKVLILDEPTRGVDVGARGEIYAIIDELANSGVTIWMISSDLEEVLGMSDRVLVLHEGQLAGELSREQLSEEAVMRLATGGAEMTVE